MSDIPYPGLRPFKREESDIFFGREEHTDQLLEKLVQTRFISVVGLSGCGKSSLVRAGMIAALETGYLSSAGAQWRVAAMRPGNHPLHNLADALLASSALGPERPDHIKLSQLIASHDPLGLIEVLRKTPLPARTNFLILVDQFEEIFRYHRQGNRNEAEAFVALLLTSAGQREIPVPIYVVTTMRSDFIGDCALFRGLPEMMNYGQFLVPRLTREQQRMAMIGPARVFGGSIEPRLVNRLLDEMGTDPDQLPILQHCLMRMWTLASPSPKPSHQEKGNDSPLPWWEGQGEGGILTLADYEAIGGLNNALPTHADEAFAELDKKGQHIAEIIFRCLCERGVNQRDTRRPVGVRNVASVAEVSASEVIEVVEVFRHPERCFLTPAAGVPLEPDSVLDIGHESLIRKWRRMNAWVEQEAQSAETYRRLEQTAYLWKQGQAALWGTPDLENALAWKEREKPTAVWANRYSSSLSPIPSHQGRGTDFPPPLVGGAGGGGFQIAMEFLEASAQAQEEQRLEEERERQQELKRVRRQLAIVGIAVVVLLIALLGAVSLWRRATNAEAEAKKQTSIAVEAREDAEQQAQIAQQARMEAERQNRIAQARQLTAQAQNVFETYPQRSLLLAIEALNVTLKEGEARVPAAEEVLRQTLANIGGLGLRGGEVAISPDNHWLVTGSDDGTVLLWDLTTISPPGRGRGGSASAPSVLHGHKGPITTIVISANSRWLVTGSRDTARLWDLSAPDPTAASVILQGHDRGITAVAISADSKWLVTAGRDTARLWDLTAPNPAAASIVLRGHEWPITSMVISADNRWLVTGSRDGTARLWDLTAPDPVAAAIVLRGHEDMIWAVATSADSRWLVTGSQDNTARLWDLTAPDPAATVIVLSGHELGIMTLAISADGHWLVTGSGDSTVRLWDLTDPDPAASSIILRDHELNITTMTISADSHWLVTGSQDSTARLWDLTAPAPAATAIVLSGHELGITTLAISADSRWLVTGSGDNTARLWDLTAISPPGRGRGGFAATPIVLHGHEWAITSVAISADNHWLVTGSRGDIARLWDLTASNPTTTSVVLHGHERDITGVALSADNHWLVTGSGDHTARLWDLSAISPPGRGRGGFAATSIILRGHEGHINTLTISADSRWLVTGSQDSTARVWDLTAPDPAASSIVLRGHLRAIMAVAISSDSRWLVTGSEDDTARLWKLTDPDPAAGSIVLRGSEGWDNDITALAISADSRWLVTGGQDAIARLWDLSVPDPAAAFTALQGHERWIITMAISPDNHWLVTGSDDNTVRVWDLTAPDPAATATVLQGHKGSIMTVAISPDSRWLVTGSRDDTTRVWDLTTIPPPGRGRGGFAATSIALHGHERDITSIAISPDSRWLVTGSQDSTVRVWDLSAISPPERGRGGFAATSVILPDHDQEITTVAISADNRWLATGSRDSTARLWRLQLDELIDLACRTTGRNLSPAEWNQYFQGGEYRQTCPALPLHWSVSQENMK